MDIRSVSKGVAVAKLQSLSAQVLHVFSAFFFTPVFEHARVPKILFVIHSEFAFPGQI
jgi:hypothetical protein